MQATVPPEIQKRGPKAEHAFLKAISSGEVQVYHGRLMFIGQNRAGKTSLKKSLLGIPFNPQEDSTVGIEVDPSMFKVDVDHVVNWQLKEPKDVAMHEFYEDNIAKIIATHLMYHNLPSVQTQPTEQRDPDVRWMDQNSLSMKENVSIQDIGSKVPASKKLKLDEKEKRTMEASMSHPDLFTGSLEERDEPLDLDIEPNVVFSSKLMERVEHYLCTGSLEERDEPLDLDIETNAVVRYLKHLKLDEEINAKEYKLDVWDFAGQHLYGASHPFFLSSRAVYILVYNLSKELNALSEPCVKQGVTMMLQNTNRETNLENLLSWLVSVRRLRPETKDDGKLLYVRPKVIIVGTNADQLAVEDRNEMLMCIQESLTENDDLQQHVIRKLFSIDNTGSQADDREALKEEILDVLRLEPYMGEKVPVRWFHFEKIVQALVAKKMHHVKREYLLTIIKKVCRIEDMEELKSMLDFYHDLGQIVQLGNTVVLDTKWLINLFRQVITVPLFNEMDPCRVSYWLELQNRGILRMELIDHMFDEHIKEGLDKEDILSLMEHYGLIAKYSTTEKRRYFVPAQLTSPPAELCETKPSDCDPCSLYVNFTEGFVPRGLFPQLLTRCIAWCSKHGFPKEPRLYDCGVRFFIGKQPFYSLVLICRKRSIKVVLTEINPALGSLHSSSEDLEPWDVRAFLDDTLVGLSLELPWLCNLEFEWCVACTGCQCPKHKSVCCLHEECLHLHKVDFSQTTNMIVCEKSLEAETIKISGLDKWFLASKKSKIETHSKVIAMPLPSKGDNSPEPVSGGNTETETGSREHMECAQTKSESEMKVAVSRDTVQTDSEALSENWIKSMLSAGTEKCVVGKSGTVWRLQDTLAACVTFSPNAVKANAVFRCILWQSTIDFPPLQKNEALVSNVIVLACDDSLGCDFTGNFDEEVSVALSHSAANLKGYEVVMRELVDSENNEWKDLKTTNIWKASDTQCDLCSAPRIPFSEAKVTRCSVFAVICRLKSYTYSTHGQRKQDFTCRVPEYPDVTVTIPASVVQKNGDFQLTLKVQEIPQQWFDESEIICPVLHIACSPAIQLVEPAIITIPTSLQENKNDCGKPSFKNAHVRLLMNSDEETSQWTEITEQLPRPAHLKKGVITFQATHFCRFFTVLIEKAKKWIFAFLKVDRAEPLEDRADRSTRHLAFDAGFFACLCRSGDKSPGESNLRYCCYPSHMENSVRKSICALYDVFSYGHGSSLEPLCPDDILYLALRKGLEPTDDDDDALHKGLPLRFLPDKEFENDIVVRVSSEHVPTVEFFRYCDEKPLSKKRLCRLSIVPPSTGTKKEHLAVKAGIPSDDVLESLSTQLGDNWKKLGRRLSFNDAELSAFRTGNYGMAEEARRMLVRWKQKEGSEATYQVLYDALIHEFVSCRLLAETFCCN